MDAGSPSRTAILTAMHRAAHFLIDDEPKILADHPETSDRVIAIEAMATSTPRRPLLNHSEWAALKSICSEK